LADNDAEYTTPADMLSELRGDDKALSFFEGKEPKAAGSPLLIITSRIHLSGGLFSPSRR
jgi:hypothetical protein